MLTIILNRLATLDPDGIGVEMEADKPGWCDSLNGLPALFGSSLCETLEVKRACLTLLKGLSALRANGVKDSALSVETARFFSALATLLKKHLASKSKDKNYAFWDHSNQLKEKFRAATFLL